jgi:hypothetical protein
MAESPSHRFGQIVGEVLEAAILPLLQDFAQTHALYLDKKGTRPARKGVRCTWVDLNKNAHNLDFVLERGGTPQKIGVPAAFIESAWRRYTKHSRNKAQEIQGAIVPLAETYRNVSPFMGATLAGVFTEGALKQLNSLGFSVLYFPYDLVIRVFRRFGIDASSDERTPDREFQSKVDAWKALTPARRNALSKALITANKAQVNAFMNSLAAAASRQVERVIILPLHGSGYEVVNIADAITFIESYDEQTPRGAIDRYDIQVRFNNGNVINGVFKDKRSALEFLATYLPPVPPQNNP